MSELSIGIDLGTTNSLAAYVVEGKVLLIENDMLSSWTPSVVTFTNKKVLVGEEALKKRFEFPEQTFFSFKRFMGKNLDTVDLNMELPFAIDLKNKNKILLGKERKVTPEELSAEILKRVRHVSSKIIGENVKKAVITVPAYFDDIQRQATYNSALIAGLEVIRIINEPTAAAVAYGLDKKPSNKIVVYDFGGGTFDVSILEYKSKIFKVLSTHGNTELGGDDIDNLVINFLLQKIGSRIDRKNSLVQQYLKKLAEEIKIELTYNKEVTKSIKIIDSVPIINIQREEFNEFIKPVIKETLYHTTMALEDAKLDIKEIDEVVLVGGSTQVPYVRQMVGNFFNKEPHVRLNPNHAVAMGAAMQAHLLSGGRKDFLLMDIIPLSLGIETAGGVFSKLIVRNSSIPVSKMETFSTQVDNQTGVDINIYQGERELVQDCRLLGKIRLKGIPPMPAGLPRVEVEFFVNANGILKVFAKELRTEIKADIEVIPQHGLKNFELEKMIEDSLVYAEEDFKQRHLVEFRLNAQNILNSIGKSWKEAEIFFDTIVLAKVSKQMEVLGAVMTQEDPQVIKRESDKLGKLTQEFSDYLVEQAIKNNLKLKK